jgi:type II secretory pathway pseudopilin PulG
MPKNKIFAFSLAETLIAISVIGVISIIAISSIVNSKARQEKINKVESLTLYTNFDSIYNDIISNKCTKGSLSTLKDINNDSKADAIDIRDMIVSAYKGYPDSCDKLVKPSDFTLGNGTVCLDMMPTAHTAIYYDATCKTEVTAIGFVGQTAKTYKDTCGYIAYSLKYSKGVLGQDFFIYPFEKIIKSKKAIKQN